MLLGCDCSEYQGRPDWATAATSGVRFAVARVSYGASHNDTSYPYNRARIPAAGIIPGAYHFLTASQAAAPQADVFCALADPAAIHALDVERAGLDVTGWVTQYRRHYPQKTLLIYTGRDLWHAAVGELNGGLIGPLWLAGVVPNGYVPGAGSLADLAAKIGTQDGGLPWGGWNGRAFTQFTDSALVPGIVGPVDGDAFHGTPDDLYALTGIGDDMQLKDLADWDISALVGLPAGSVNFQTAIGRMYSATQRTEVEVGQIAAAVEGLTPAAVVAAVQSAFPQGLSSAGAPVDPQTLAEAITARLDLRPQLRDVLLHGAASQG